uniref:Uncharacterized protein n=1 Tax=Arundo donax TaxID=35708 RepID=A0A0A9AVD6_ARUDO
MCHRQTYSPCPHILSAVEHNPTICKLNELSTYHAAPAPTPRSPHHGSSSVAIRSPQLQHERMLRVLAPHSTACYQ